MGDRVAHLRAGIEGLRRRGLEIGVMSSFYLTEPDLQNAVGAEGSGAPDAADTGIDTDSVHPWYVNCVAAVGAAPAPAALLSTCQQVEREEGRQRDTTARGSNGTPTPRTLDIDVLLFGDRVIREPGIEIPHPRMCRRRFVLQPLAEIAPDVRHPVTGVTIAEMLAELPQRERVSLLEPQPDVSA